MKIDKKGLNLIREFEGCKLSAYKCPAGVWTIGIGSTFYDNGKRVEQGQTLASEAAALDLLSNTLASYEYTVNSLHILLTQNEFDALVCLCYNIGAGNFLSSTLVKLLKQGEPKAEVALQFLRWNKAGGKELQGLTRRRQAEMELFLS